MVAGVLGARHHFKVFKAVIRLILVAMVNNFIAGQRPAKVILH
jgi:hypothetical protein